MRTLEKLREQIQGGLSSVVKTASLGIAAALVAGGMVFSSTCLAASSAPGDIDRIDKGPNVYLMLNNHDTSGMDLTGKMSIPADKWYYEAKKDGTYAMEFRLGSDKNTSTKADIKNAEKWRSHIRPFATLGFGKYTKGRIGFKGYFGLSSTYGPEFTGIDVDGVSSIINAAHSVDGNISFTDGAGNVRNFGILELPKVSVDGYRCVGWSIEGRLGKHGSALSGDYTSSKSLYGAQNYYYNESDGTSGKTIGKEWLWNEGWALKDLRTERHATFQGNPFSKNNVGNDMAFRGTGKGYVIVCTPILKAIRDDNDPVDSSSGHTVYFDLNGGQGHTGHDGTNMASFEYGDTCSYLKADYTAANISKSGYYFGGWNTAADGSGNWMDETTMLCIDSDVTVYAQWVPEDYTITYDAVSGTIGGQRQVSVDLAYGSDINAAGIIPERKGYDFAGWYTDGGNGSPVTAVTGDQTVYAHWNPRLVKVRFYSDNTLYAEKEVYAGSRVNGAVDFPRKNGCLFKGWVRDLTKEDYVSSVEEDTDLYAVFYIERPQLKNVVEPEVKTYTYTEVTPEPEADITIIADANGGTFGKKDETDVTVVTGKVKKGASITKAFGTPTRTGYTFAGWYTGKVDGSLAEEAQNTSTVYAHWTPVKCTVQFSAPAGAVDVPNAQTVDYGYDVSNFEVPSMSGASFVGWSDSSDGTGVVKNIYGNMTLYARFSINSYSISFDANEGRFANGASQITEKVQQDCGFENLAIPTREDYVFTGWYSLAENGDLVETAKADQTVYAGWKKVSYTLSLDPNGADAGFGSREVSFGQEIGDLPVLKRDGYIFKGWNEEKTGTGAAISYNTLYNKKQNSVAYAVWEKVTYTLTIDDGVTISSRKISKGDALGNLGTPKKAKSKFAGWFIDGKQVGDTTIYDFEEDKNVVASWTDGDYAINYGMNSNDGYAEPGAYRASQTAKYGEYVKLEDAVDTRDGFTFKSWNTEENGNGTSYDAGSMVKDLAVEDDSVDLYAQWGVNHYNISFDSNKPQRVKDAKLIGDMKTIKDIAYTDTIAAPECAYVITGAAVNVCFKGWNTKADGSGDFYEAGSDLNALTGVDGATVTLYAQWFYQLTDQTKIFVGRYEVTDDPIYSPVENPPFKLVVDGYQINKDDVKIDYVTNDDGTRKVVFTVTGEYQGVIERGFIVGKDPSKNDYSFPEDFEEPGASAKPGTSGNPDIDKTPNPNASDMPTTSDAPVPGTSNSPQPATTGIGLMTPGPNASDSSGNVPDGYIEVTPPPSARDEYDYTITYVIPQGAVIEDVVFGYKAGVGVDLPKKVTKEGYNFKGWFGSIAFEGSPITTIGSSETGDKRFFAKMLLKSQDPDENGRGNDNGNGPSASSNPSDSSGIDKDCPFKDNLEPNGGTVNKWHEDWTQNVIPLPTDVTKEGYIFGGWYLHPDFSGDPVTSISRVDLVNGVKVYAKWIPATYKIKYVLNGIGSLPAGAVDKVTHGKSVKLAIPTSSTHKFEGWYTDAGFKGAKVTETGNAVIGNLTFYAKWKVVQKTKGGLIYRITGTNEASLVGTTNRTIKTLSVPKTVKLKYKGKTRKYKVSRVNGRAFKGCKKLKKVTIGENVGVLGIYAFKGCKNLQTVTVKGNKLLKIRESVFSGDKKLKKVVIKSSRVNQIGKRAFKDCKKAKVYVRARVKKIYTKMIRKKGSCCPKKLKIKAI